MDGEDIRRHVREIGFGDAIIKKVLEDLCRLRFMHTTSHSAPTFESDYVVSRLGGYVVRRFIADLMYLENVMMDTFIADENVWETLKEQTAQIYAERNIIRRIRIRKARALEFFKHMKKLYDTLYDESIRRGLPREWCTHPLRTLEKDFEKNLLRVMSSAERLYGPNAAAS